MGDESQWLWLEGHRFDPWFHWINAVYLGLVHIKSVVSWTSSHWWGLEREVSASSSDHDSKLCGQFPIKKTILNRAKLNHTSIFRQIKAIPTLLVIPFDSRTHCSDLTGGLSIEISYNIILHFLITKWVNVEHTL